MSRQQAKAPEPIRMNTELFTLTYGSLVAQIVKDFESDDAINEQLDNIGFNIGQRLAEDFVAKVNSGRCSDFKETANQLVTGFRHFLGVSPAVSKFSPAGDEFSLTLDSNPLTEFVDLPADHPKLLYCNVLAGAIRGALHSVQLEVDARIVLDQLRGDKKTEIRVKFIRRIKEMSSSTNPSSVGTNISEAWLIKALRLLHSQKPEDTARLRKLYKDSCENESAVARITLAEALRVDPSGPKEENSPGSERGVARQRISAQGPFLASESSQSDSGGSKSSKLINFFDLTTTTSTHVSTVSSKNRSPPSTTNVPIIPVVMCQGKTIITEQSSTVVMPNSGLIGGNGNGGEANSPPVGMEAMEDLVADLMCCVCGRMTAAADPDANEAFPSPIESPVTNNVLVECTRCRSLYHQLCHSPPLITARVPSGWLCSRCSDSSYLSKRRSSTSPSSDPASGYKKSKG
ncbi:unnamed protein product [Hydatigera taeniaeformis]|uniref:PHD-type domain-containing protein n=1 Tax=Hydatigena taeniaeformis TaxID=6205 RepID=A0A0R3X9S4_HYDTA|nr:unnamed protein product [Hydatigera taeniaeformis]